MDCGFGLLLFLSMCAFACGIGEIGIKRSSRQKAPNKVCYGTENFLSISGNVDLHYRRMRREYTGCTYVDGNLEITHLGRHRDGTEYDLSFLSDIRVVRGYVLIGVTGLQTISLPNLVLIKAEKTTTFKKGNLGLLVLGNGNLQSLLMPALKEISDADVMFASNPGLCFIDTVAWDVITEGKVTISKSSGAGHCTECPAYCTADDGMRHCWGSGPENCQEVERRECDEICSSRCHSEGLLGCCHPECAAGCTGSMPTECTMCKNFRHRGKCMSACPPGSYPDGQECQDF